MNDSFETVGNVCKRESALRGFTQLVVDRPVWTAFAILAFVGCVSFVSTERAQAQEAQSVSCEDKCYHDKKVCLYNQSSPELCDYDYKQCKAACAEKK